MIFMFLMNCSKKCQYRSKDLQNLKLRPIILCQLKGDLTRESIKLIFTQKRQMIMKSGILDMVPLKERPEDIGGLENLKLAKT